VAKPRALSTQDVIVLWVLALFTFGMMLGVIVYIVTR
jgi:phage shock protein PspC (stress-responsive transcriptional regulator)